MTAKTKGTEVGRARLAEEQTSRQDPPWWWATIQIAALSLHVPLTVLSGTQRALSSVSGAVTVGAAVTASFLLLYWAIRRILRSGWRSLALVSAGALLFWHGSSLSVFADHWAWLINVIVAGLILVAAFRHADRRLFKLISFVASATLGVTLLLLIVLDIASTPEPVVAVHNPVQEVVLRSTPDIYLVVFDGYGRADVLETLYDFDNSDFLTTLESHGFDIAERASSNYTITHLSLPSLLNMSYMNKPSDVVHNSDLEELAKVTSGDNTFVRILKNHGYTYVHGDSDHWFNSCGPLVDVCLEGPLLDVTGHALLLPTPVGSFIYPKSGDPTTALNLLRIEEMARWNDVRPQTDAPLFVLLHLVLPHPPLFLDSDCEVRIDEDLRQRIMNDGSTSQTLIEKRKEAWIEQVECANKTVLEFLPNVDDDDLILFVSDHGPDANFHHGNIADDTLRERLPILTAGKLPPSCDGSLPPDVHLVNLLRVVIDCLSEDEIEPVEDRYFAAIYTGPIIELEYDNSADN